MCSVVLTLAMLLFVFSIGHAQKRASSPAPSPAPATSPSPMPSSWADGTHFDYIAPRFSDAAAANRLTVGRTNYETDLGWGVLLFGAILIGLEMVVMLRLKKGWGTQNIRVVGITLVIIAGLFLIVTGYSQDQIAPMIGLLGTIVGFLLGETSKNKDDDAGIIAAC